MLVSDTVLAIKVKNAIGGDPDLGDLGLRASVVDGVVTLEGSVSDERLKSLAGEIAEAVHGVDEVENRLHLEDLR
jgi:osmotically-inducible protein OsmY